MDAGAVLSLLGDLYVSLGKAQAELEQTKQLLAEAQARNIDNNESAK